MDNKYLENLKEYSYNGKNRKVIQESNNQELIHELVTLQNLHYYLLEYNNNNGIDKILYINKFDRNELTPNKWAGAIFGLNNDQFDRLIKGQEVKDILMYSALFGKESAFKIVDIIKKAKILDKGTASYGINILKKNQITNFEGSKYFSNNIILKWKVQFLTKAVWIPLGALFISHRVMMKVDKI